MVAEIGRRRMLSRAAAEYGPQETEHRLRPPLRAMRIAGGSEPTEEFEQQLGCDHDGDSLADGVTIGDADNIATLS
jgi:hypothetical protein